MVKRKSSQDCNDNPENPSNPVNTEAAAQVVTKNQSEIENPEKHQGAKPKPAKEPKRRDAQYWGNWIQCGMLLVSGILAIFTYLVYVQAANQGAEISKQFYDDNKPFLQIKSYSADSYDYRKPIKITYTIENLGKHPVKIENCYFTGNIDVNIGTIQNKDYVSDPHLINRYIFKDAPYTGFFTLNPISFDETKWGVFIFDGVIEYRNQVTNVLGRYTFSINPSPVNLKPEGVFMEIKQNELRVNENVVIK